MFESDPDMDMTGNINLYHLVFLLGGVLSISFTP